MKTPVPRAAVLVLLVSASAPAWAQFSFFDVEDSAEKLTGSFSGSGISSDSYTAFVFQHLPGGDPILGAGAYLDSTTDPPVEYFEISTHSSGSPEDPYLWSTGHLSAYTVSGRYNNTVDGQMVNWQFTNLTWDGSTFSGSFSFEVVPEPHEYGLLAGLGLAGFALGRRRDRS
jgi:MYXO-CTERM domain-containing protein